MLNFLNALFPVRYTVFGLSVVGVLFSLLELAASETGAFWPMPLTGR